MSEVLLGRDAVSVGGVGASSSAVSWAAVIAGALVASALSLMLVTLGTGIGLGSLSPWSGHSTSAETFGILAAVWFIAIQIFSAGVGGYLAGRLRTRWNATHTDEVYFRDTAHGLLVWALGTVISAALLASLAASVVSGAVQAGSSAVQGLGSAIGAPAAQMAAKSGSSPGDITAYFDDMLMRGDHVNAPADNAASRAEIARIMARGLASGDLSAPDRTYVAQVVASHTGLSQQDAEKRVSDVVSKAKDAMTKAADAAKTAADAARKAGVVVSLWAFIALLIGAFSASYMATVGGRVRDDLPTMG